MCQITFLQELSTLIWQSPVHKSKISEVNPQMAKKPQASGSFRAKPLSIAAVSSYLDTRTLGSTMAVVGNIDSTNMYIKKHAAALDDGFVIISDSQTNGRGRLGKTFCSPEGGLYMSVLLMGRSFADNADSITVRAAVAVRDAIAEISGISDVGIKWVNDIYIGEKKVCGILAERVVKSGTFDFCVVGIGVNVFTPKKKFDSSISDIAGSLSDFTKADFSKNRLAALILNHLEKNLFAKGKLPNSEILDKYRSYSVIIGKNIYITDGEKTVPAFVLGIDDDASLYVRYQDDTTAILRSGTVSTKLSDNKKEDKK